MSAMEISNLVRTTRFWHNLHQTHQRSKEWKAKQLSKPLEHEDQRNPKRIVKRGQSKAARSPILTRISMCKKWIKVRK